jgi:hypothetical protein
VLGAITLGFYLILLVSFKRPPVAAAGTSLLVIALWSAASAILSALVAVLLWRLLRLMRGGTGWRWELVARFARTLSVALLVIVMIGTLPGIPTFTPKTAAVGRGFGPSIYVMLLDAYPRADALMEWGYDNEWFLSSLEARGFDVARSSTSNYDRTQHSLTSLLYMEHLEEIEALQQPPPDIFGRLHLLTRLIAEGGPLFELLRIHGYRVMTVPSPVVDVTMWGADVVDVGQVSDYEIHLINDTDVGHLATTVAGTDWLAEQARQGVRAQFAALLASQGPGRFVWAHLMVPHPPYVFGPSGGIAECFPACRYWTPGKDATQRLVDQVHEVNALVLDAVDQIAPEAIVVLISDHGANLPGAPNRFGNLIAVRAPRQESLLPDDATLITVFPRIFNAYFGSNIPIPEDRHYDGGPPGRRLELTPVDSG